MYTPIQPTLGITADPLDGAVWRKSSYSGTQGNCVEVASNLPGLVVVRDSKRSDGPKLILSPAAWRAFIRGLKDGWEVRPGRVGLPSHRASGATSTSAR
ncbi:MAG TPA: DUF397 domain-containing protein [Streptosporangiaceae bacterium]|nr:DUF397 domain-containing protein [Streptosporangiaceae bacterium]